MGEDSKIAWTDDTFNPWMGCTKVSPACMNCYAEALMDLRYGKAGWGPKSLRVRTSKGNWNKPKRWNRDAEAAGVRRRVFCSSLADVFEGSDTMSEESLPIVEQARLDLWALIEATPHLDWLLLTKRPENILAMVPGHWRGAPGAQGGVCSCGIQNMHGGVHQVGCRNGWPSNVWIGASVEGPDQQDRILDLLLLPAPVRFISVEPMLGELALRWCLNDMTEEIRDSWGCTENDDDYQRARGLQWVICGAESLNKREGRVMEKDWVRSLRDQCADAGVPFFYKQAIVDGRIVELPYLDGVIHAETP